MAESAVSFLVQNVSTLLQEEAKLLFGVSSQIRSVRDELEWIRSFLRDANKKWHQYERVKVWVTQVRDVAYDMEDIIDTYILKVERHRHRNLTLMFISRSIKVKTIHKVGMQLKEIEERLEKISANRTRYGLDQLIEPSESSGADEVPKEKRAPAVEEADVVGFDKDAENLAKALLARESKRRAVVSIVAMGGVGKTTLAKYVTNRRDIKDGFQVHAWVYVSQEYRLTDLLLNITKQVMVPTPTKEQEKEMENMTEEQLRSKLLKNLCDKRYLVVVDDIWAKESWDLIEKAFPDNLNGSRIMLTTRNEDVALHASPSIIHRVDILDEDKSWKLFCKKVFPASSCPTELKSLGKQIVAKAGGLPLAIVILGGLLSTKQKASSIWEKVLASVDWHLFEGSNQCSQVLALSYKDLPYYLKTCFLYFGMFPEDKEIKVDRLIRLWIAEGFIQERGRETMEDVAEDYLEELIQRSMVQIATKRGDGSVEACRMHDLLRDLAISEAKQDRFLEIYGSPHSVEAYRYRRLTIHLGKGKYDSSTMQQYSMENLRSLLFFNEGFGKDIWRFFGGGVKLLRVLDLSRVDIEELPKEIGDLILLKYLRLGGIFSRKLPTSIGNLINLQTLDLLGTSIHVTPYMLRNMHQLRHLMCEYFDDISRDTCCGCDWICNLHVSNRIDHLRNLQTLITFVCGSINGLGLEKLSNLRHLQLAWRLDQYSKVLSDSLANFLRLRSLHLNWDRQETLPLVSFSHHMHLTRLVLTGKLEKLPDKEDFPPNLASLTLYNSKIKESVNPMATLEKLPNLRTLALLNGTYLGKKMTCSREGFANLHHLDIELLDNLEEWIVKEGAMPNLRSLLVWCCPKLRVISDSLKQISTLKDVKFWVMPEEIHKWWQRSSGSNSGDGGEDTEITNVNSSGGTWSSHEGGPKEICAGEAEGASKSEATKEIVSEKRS